MTSELRKLIYFTIELILLGAIVTIVAVMALIGRDSLNVFVDAQYAKLNLPEVVAYSKGSVGYYELVDLIDTYAPVTEVEISYSKEVEDTSGGTSEVTSVVTFTSVPTNGKGIRLAVGDKAPEYGEPFSGHVYSRQEGKLYCDGRETTPVQLALDMKLQPLELNGLDSLYGNGVLDYEFIEKLFEWAKDERFICTVVQLQDTSQIERISLQIQK
jgi:hypothetical protein